MKTSTALFFAASSAMISTVMAESETQLQVLNSDQCPSELDFRQNAVLDLSGNRYFNATRRCDEFIEGTNCSCTVREFNLTGLNIICDNKCGFPLPLLGNDCPLDKTKQNAEWNVTSDCEGPGCVVKSISTPHLMDTQIHCEKEDDDSYAPTPTPTPETTQRSCDNGEYAYENKMYCKCPAPVQVKAKQFEVSVCGDATYLLPEGVQPCSGDVSTDAKGMGCPMRNDTAVRHCREEILSYLTGGKTGVCKAPENAKCEKLGSGAWGCVFPGNCNTINTCMEKPKCEGDYQRDADGACKLGENGYPLVTANNTNTYSTKDSPKLTEGVNFKTDSASSAVTVTYMTLVVTITMASIFV